MLRDIPVTHVAGVGQVKQQGLANLGIYSVDDLIHYFPYRYEDRRSKPFESFQDGEKVTFRGIVDGASSVRHQGSKSVCSVQIRVDGKYPLRVFWFNQPYLHQKLHDGRVLMIFGKYDEFSRRVTAIQTDFQTTSDKFNQEFVPIYRVPKMIRSSQVEAIIRQALNQFQHQIEDVLPTGLRLKYRLISHGDAVQTMHLPKNSQNMHQARRRLAFEEFFIFQLQLQWLSAEQIGKTVGRRRRPLPVDAFQTFQSTLPYLLTTAQVVACKDIAHDLQQSRAMQRLIQGDVGSGKTWIALWAIYANYLCGYQSAFMAPTEILAEQHFTEASKYFLELGLHTAILTGSTSEKSRQELLYKVGSGEVHTVIGTHALLTEDVEFHNLGLVVTDEQHRFGVSQRSRLRQKGETPDALLLSATPIPRTLALAIYGDLDVSTVRELPAGRKPIVTRSLGLNQEAEVIRFIRKLLAHHQQVYIVAPLVSDSEELINLESATTLASRLTEDFAGYSVGLLHGQLPSREKEQTMRRFMNAEVQVLVSTTVIEVGVNVPNATVMMIYHAERFGLAQLHQLRGRVGRGQLQSYCILLSDAKGETAKARLNTLVETTDGFEIAEKDLQLRGPGEFLGVRQSGLPEFTVGDLVRDFKIMEVAREEATTLLKSTDFWLLPSYQALKSRLEQIPSSQFRD